MKVRIGIVGGGLIAQAIHLPNLMRLSHLFDLRALADPSERVRETLSARYAADAHADWRSLVEREELDAILVCSPHATHAEVVLGALDAGLHVLVEKPLCIDPQDVDRIASTSQRSGLVVQVGYMKRFDPAYEELLADLPEMESLRYVDVVTYDPWMARSPFVDTLALVPADDIPQSERERVEASQLQQVEAVVGTSTPDEAHVFAHTYLACLIHDVNLVHGVLGRLGEPLPVPALSSSTWSEGRALAASFELSNGAVWNSAWMLLPGVDEFRETATFYFDDQVVALEFPAPYLRGAPTRLIRRRRENKAFRSAVSELHGSSYERELEHFHACITDDETCRTPPEQSRLDLVALRDLYLARRTATCA